MIDIQGIREALPHRYPMLLVDRVLEVSEDEITAIKNVTINEPFLLNSYNADIISTPYDFLASFNNAIIFLPSYKVSISVTFF